MDTDLQPQKESPWIAYDIKIKRLGSHFEIREYDDVQFKLKPGETLGIKREVPERCTTGVFRLDSLMRSWQIMSDVAVANQNEWQSFITLTFKENITDLDEANAKFNIYVTQMRRACDRLGFKFKYVGVPEFQERGCVHYHLVTNVKLNHVYEHHYTTKKLGTEKVRICKLIPRRKTKVVKGKAGEGTRKLNYYNLPFWPKATYGYSSAFGFDSVDDKFTVVGYLAKYFFKGYRELKTALADTGDMTDVDLRLYGRIKILVSRNLEPVKSWHFDYSKLCPWFLDFIRSEGIMYQETKKPSPSKHIPGITLQKFQKKSLT